MNAAIPAVAASSPGMASTRLLKNVSPPRCPDAIRACNEPKKTAKATINQAEYLPSLVVGLKWTLMIPL
jgi:hypothetical protein